MLPNLSFTLLTSCTTDVDFVAGIQFICVDPYISIESFSGKKVASSHRRLTDRTEHKGRFILAGGVNARIRAQTLHCSYLRRIFYVRVYARMIGAHVRPRVQASWTFKARGGYSSSSRAGRLGRTLWPQNSTSVAETEKGGQNSTMTPPHNARKGGSIFYISMKSLQKKGVKNLQF